jgi:catechol 2,3-dioxygenase-like lactoylglutathione lyase family enzyme
MQLVHAGLTSRSEAAADRFFGGVLGLEQTRRSALPAELARPLFGVDEGCEILYYGGGNLLLEVFVTGRRERAAGKIDHLCIEVADRGELLAKCATEGFAVREVAKGEGVIVFIEDGDGNLFEIKQR